jgi:hypothetical protein
MKMIVMFRPSYHARAANNRAACCHMSLNAFLRGMERGDDRALAQMVPAA